MRILIVEDEASAARRLERQIARAMDAEPYHLTVAAFCEDARNMLASEPIDLLFLDLNLHGNDGFSLLAEAVACRFETIVVSANTDRALEAFEYGVLDFIPKPCTEARLRQALDRFRQRSQRAIFQPVAFLAVRATGKLALIPVDEVAAIHGAGNYSEIETKDGRRMLHDKTLDALAARMPSRFVRIHRSHIVDWTLAVRLRSFPGSRYLLELKSGGPLPVSRGKISDLKKRLLL